MNEKELDELISTTMHDNISRTSTIALHKIHSQFKAYIQLTEIVDECRKGGDEMLRNIITELKQTGGEHWAVGEMLESTLILLNALDYENKQKRQ